MSKTSVTSPIPPRPKSGRAVSDWDKKYGKPVIAKVPTDFERNTKTSIFGAGKDYLADKIISDAANPSPAYEARQKGGLPTVKPPMTTPVGRSSARVASVPPTVAPVTSPVVTMASPPPDTKPAVQSQTSSPSRGALVTANAKAGLPAARTADEVQRTNLGLPEVGPPKSAMNKPDGDVYSNEDMSKQGYTLIGGKSGVKKWRKGAEMDAMNKSAAAQTKANIIASPVFRGRAGAPQAPKPLETESRIVNNKPRLVQTGGDTTPEFERIKAAQDRVGAGTDSAEDMEISQKANRDAGATGWQPSQVAQLRADERAGKYQGGRKVR